MRCKLMNTSNIQIGQIIAYKKMCLLLEEPYYRTGGNAKSKQLDNWNRYFDWEKVGLKFKITKIYDEPKPEVIKARNTKFTPLICHLLMMRMQDRYITTSKNKLLNDLMMKSPEYNEENKQNKNLDDVAFSFINYELNKRLKDALKSLKNSGVIKLNAYNVKFHKGKFETELLTDEENKTLEKIIESSIWEYQHRKNRRVFTNLNNIRLEYGMTEYTEIKNSMIEKEFGCSIMEEYHIEVMTNSKVYYLEEELQELSEEDLMIELNHRLNDSIIKTLETKLHKDYYSYDYQRHEPSKDKIKRLVQLNRVEHEPKTTIITDENKIRELNIMYKKYGNSMWDNSDEEYIPDGTTPF